SNHLEGLARVMAQVAGERRHLIEVHGPGLAKCWERLDQLRQRHGLHLVACEGPEVVGWGEVMPETAEARRHVGVLSFGLAARLRGHGFGRLLLNTTVRQAFLTTNLARLELEVLGADEISRHLIEHQGFREEGCKVGGWRLDGRSDDILIYALGRK
ncbi:MAG: hypothetical protein RIR00_181, partial [Pseudomonadota bacterium]